MEGHRMRPARDFGEFPKMEGRRELFLALTGLLLLWGVSIWVSLPVLMEIQREDSVVTWTVPKRFETSPRAQQAAEITSRKKQRRLPTTRAEKTPAASPAPTSPMSPSPKLSEQAASTESNDTEESGDAASSHVGLSTMRTNLENELANEEKEGPRHRMSRNRVEWLKFVQDTNWKLLDRNRTHIIDLVESLRGKTHEYATEALKTLKRIEQVDCVPKLCLKSPGFYPNKPGLSKMFLVSYPGSGNTFLRSIMRGGTRYYTGSVFSDKELGEGGFQGESLKPWSPEIFLVKTHYPFHAFSKGFPQDWAEAGLFLVRSPFDAMLAELNRVSARGHRNVGERSRLETSFNRKHRTMAWKWSQMMDFWEPNTTNNDQVDDDMSFPEVKAFKDLEKKQDGPFRIRVVPLPRRPEGFPVATFFYEDLVRDRTTVLAYLFAFVKAWYDNEAPWLIPSVHDAVICALNDLQAQEKFHRPHPSNASNPFTDANPNADQLSVDQLCNRFERHWNQDRWGECSGNTQRERQPQPTSHPLLNITSDRPC